MDNNSNNNNINNNYNNITIIIHHATRWRTLYREVSVFMFLRWETTVSTVNHSTTITTNTSRTNTTAATNLSSSESQNRATSLPEPTLLSTSILLGYELTKQRGHHLRPGGVTTHSFLILIVKIYKIFSFANSGYFVIYICTW